MESAYSAAPVEPIRFGALLGKLFQHCATLPLGCPMMVEAALRECGKLAQHASRASFHE